MERQSKKKKKKREGFSWEEKPIFSRSEIQILCVFWREIGVLERCALDCFGIYLYNIANPTREKERECEKDWLLTSHGNEGNKKQDSLCVLIRLIIVFLTRTRSVPKSNLSFSTFLFYCLHYIFTVNNLDIFILTVRKVSKLHIL